MKDKVLIITLVFLIFLCAGFVVWFISMPKSSGKETIDEVTAVQIIQNEYPEMNGYPSDRLPPKSIRTEKSDDGWYVAFVEEGSGRPIISAMCYFVDNTQNIVSIRTYIPEIEDDSFAPFSAKTCSPGGRD
jgi:hypothetical protein